MYPDFHIFDLPDIFLSRYSHCHISSSLNIIKNKYQIFFVRPFSSMINK